MSIQNIAQIMRVPHDDSRADVQDISGAGTFDFSIDLMRGFNAAARHGGSDFPFAVGGTIVVDALCCCSVGDALASNGVGSARLSGTYAYHMPQGLVYFVDNSTPVLQGVTGTFTFVSATGDGRYATVRLAGVTNGRWSVRAERLLWTPQTW